MDFGRDMEDSEFIHSSIDTSIEEIGLPTDYDYNCIVGNNLWFYNNLHCVDKPLIYEHLLNIAEEKICIWDPYTNTRDANLFRLINRGIDVKCLTLFEETKIEEEIVRDYSSKKSRFISNLRNIQSENNFNLKLRVYYFNKMDDRFGFHDRYLFIDDDVYIVGSSMGYHNTLNRSKPKSTAIYKVSDELDKRIIRNMFYQYWDECRDEEVLTLYEEY